MAHKTAKRSTHETTVIIVPAGDKRISEEAREGGGYRVTFEPGTALVLLVGGTASLS